MIADIHISNTKLESCISDVHLIRPAQPETILGQ